MNEFVICPRCGEKLKITKRITDRDWSRMTAYFASHTNNRQCSAQFGIRYFRTKDALIESFENKVNYDAD